MTYPATRIAVSAVLALLALSLAQAAKVRVWEEGLLIPTYNVGPPDTNPRFYAGRAYQGAQGRVYPYPMIDAVTDNRTDETYNAVYLENEYIKVCVLPEIGGRVFSALDKTNDHDFFYHQHVIKPALIGMIGAWISGGIEWNFPHHHRPSVFMPIDYILQENPDGSGTVWVGELEIRHRMRWIIGLTLYPGKSYLEATLKPMNRTPFVQTFLFFANASAHSNSDYQVFFPPGTEYVTYHGKNQFAHWPFSQEIYNGIDYTEGVDVSWWKNHPEWTSMFAWNYEDDFFAGYDHGKEVGTVSVANHHVAPGKKFWEWSAGPRGDLWDKILTETDGPELELMTGVYSDNQPDYSWLQPYETKVASIYWYPIRDLGGIKAANLKGAANLEVDSEKARIAFNTVEKHENAIVKLNVGNKVIFEEKVEISPDRPFSREVALPVGTSEFDLRTTLSSAQGNELVSYQPEPPKNSPMPDPVKPPPAPGEIDTVEELYLAGSRLEQFYNPALEPEPYYEEALRRDSGHYDTNLAMGISCFKRGMFEDAEKRFQTAVERVTHNYTSPRKGEAHYYLGLVQRRLGKVKSAYDALYKATWSQAFHTAAYHQLAEMECEKRNYSVALDHITRAIATNNWSVKSLNLKSATLRYLGRFEEALEVSSGILSFDPLNFWGRNERQLGLRSLGQKAEADAELIHLKKLMHDQVQSYLEVAVDYGNGGFWSDAIELLSRLTNEGKGVQLQFPMVYYYLGYYSARLGEQRQADEYYRLAAEMPPDYCFPFRLESIDVLKEASEMNPRDAKAPYYLGNLFYDHQPEEAVRAWEKSRALDDTYATVHRNLAIGYERVERDIPKAITSMEKAIHCDSTDPRLFYELDLLYEKGLVPATERLTLLEANRKTVEKRDDSMSRIVLLYVQTNRYDQAIDILANRHFHVWEGSRGLRDAYVDAHLMRGLERFNAGEYGEALSDYLAALEFPLNLENAWPYRGGRTCEIFYFVASGYEALGEKEKAREFYLKAAEAKQRPEWSHLRYYEAMALRSLGQLEKSERLLDGLLEFASTEVASSVGFFSKFGEKEPLNVRRARNHYLSGLANWGKGLEDKAKSEFLQALGLDPNNVWARIQLSRLG
jgi:tetratricopeptide (TPR) repeat protein